MSASPAQNSGLTRTDGAETMKHLIRSFDWANTSVGPVERWPQSLKATIKTMLGSRYPMILLWGEDLIQIYNDAYTGLIGDKHPYALGHSIKETQAESWSTIGPMIREVMTTGIPNWVPAQMLAVNRSGYTEETYFSLSYSAVENDEGVIQGMLCVCSEVTQQILGERRLRLQRDLASKAGETRSLDQVCHDLGIAIADYHLDVPFALLYLLEPDGTLTRRNVVGAKANDPSCQVHIDLKTQTEDPWSIKKAFAGETIFINNIDKFIDIAGGPWDNKVNAAITLPIPSSSNTKPLGVLVAGVSPSRHLDEGYSSFYSLLAGQISMALRNALAHEEERKRVEALAEIDRAKTTFFSNVSHEFRTPLTLMLGPLEEMIATSSGSGSGEEVQLTTVYHNALRLLKLVNTLLDFSRIEAKRAEASYTPVDLCTFTSELASAFESAIKSAGLNYQVECNQISEPVYIDPEMWEKIVFNLLSNALKFTFDGKIILTLADTETHAILSVKDTGVGIPSSELPNIFKRFYRIQNIRSRSHEGTGIGLALVKELVALQGGTINVNSIEGMGTTFTITVPKGTAHLDLNLIRSSDIVRNSARTKAFINEASLWSKDETTRVTLEAATHENALADKSISVLLADDNKEMRAYLERILGAYWSVVTAKDGEIALNLIKLKQPDIVVSDVMMPNMDGFQLLSEIRRDVNTQHIPIILLSARAGEEATLEGLEKGANDYLVKPFSARELIARVKTQLEIQRTRRDNVRLSSEIVNEKLFSEELEKKVFERTLDLKKINDELREFAYVASHDLQEPLRKIIIYTDLVKKSLDPLVPVHAHLEKISQASVRMKDLIKDLLDLSKLSQKEVARVSVNLNEIWQQVKNDFELLITQKNATISADDLPTVTAIPLQMHQLFYNIIGNALKFTSEVRAPRIRVRSRIAPGELIKKFPSSLSMGKTYFSIEFEDNGIGFNEKYLGRIFTIFQRLHTTDDFPGTGIGLALCKKIVTNHQGEIFASSKEGEGSTFFVILPA